MCLDGPNWTPHSIDPRQPPDSKLRIKLSGVAPSPRDLVSNLLVWELLLAAWRLPRGSGETIGFCEIGTFFSASFRFFRGAWSAVGEEIFWLFGFSMLEIC